MPDTLRKPSILIGIGTSGLKVLEHVQHFSFENTGENKLDHVSYLYLETDNNSKPELTPVDNKIQRINIKVEDNVTMVNSLREKPDTEWIPDPNYFSEAGNGAGGIPSYGRSILWGNKNFEEVTSSIKNAYSQIVNITKRSEDTTPTVFLTGSLTGGTGSGMFIDMAYIVKALIPNIKEVFGLFLVPRQEGFEGRQPLFINTLTSLQALDYYNKRNHPYKMTWPNGNEVNFDEPPFDLFEIISQQYNAQLPDIRTLSGLYKLAGLYLFLNVFGLNEKRWKRLTDAQGNNHIENFATFGLSAIQYPKAQLENYLAIELGISLLERWTDPLAYYSNNNKIQLGATKTAQENITQKRFDKILRGAFESLDGVELGTGVKLFNDLQTKVRIINKRQHNESSDYHYILNLFSANSTGNYYQAISNNIKNAVDHIILEIHRMVSNDLDRFENLQLAKNQLDAVTKAIDNVLAYWRNDIQISGQAVKWEAILDHQIQSMLKNRYKVVLQENNVLYDRLRDLMDLLKMHLLANKLVDIRNCIQNEEIIMKTFEKGIQLPTIPRIEKLIEIINQTVKADMGIGETIVSRTLTSRKYSIENDISDISIPILRIFRNEGHKEILKNFTEEVESGKRIYFENTNSQLVSKDVFVGQGSLWDYLNKEIDTLSETLYKHVIIELEREIRKNNCIQDYEVSEYFVKNPTYAQQIAAKAIQPLLPINPDRRSNFESSNFLPKLVIASNQKHVSDVIGRFHSDNYNEFNDDEDGRYINDELKNIMVFFAERGYMTNARLFNPATDLKYIHDIKRLYYSWFKAQGDKYTLQEWHLLRNPYLKPPTVEKLIKVKSEDEENPEAGLS